MMVKPKCKYCGRPINRTDLKDGTVKVAYIPDSIFTEESIEYFHVRCEARQ